MRAIDTNVLVRYLIGDDARQAQTAATIMGAPCFVSNTVLLETGWLLSSRFGIKRAALTALMRNLVALPTVSVGNAGLLAWALDRFEAGADFADMLHVIDAGQVDRFATFDRAIASATGPDTPVPIETLT